MVTPVLADESEREAALVADFLVAATAAAESAPERRPEVLVPADRPVPDAPRFGPRVEVELPLVFLRVPVAI
ncbi:MAG: hypothetical protein FWG25_09000 [Promicromonosporaceae bacterium]|nr:hypothetical protein [Promicromonosporaceae bacterium]